VGKTSNPPPFPSATCPLNPVTSAKGVLRGDGPHADLVVGEPAEEGLAVRGPRDRHALGVARFGTDADKVWLELVDDRP
jgi:hypothetical protein